MCKYFSGSIITITYYLDSPINSVRVFLFSEADKTVAWPPRNEVRCKCRALFMDVHAAFCHLVALAIAILLAAELASKPKRCTLHECIQYKYMHGIACTGHRCSVPDIPDDRWRWLQCLKGMLCRTAEKPSGTACGNAV